MFKKKKTRQLSIANIDHHHSSDMLGIKRKLVTINTVQRQDILGMFHKYFHMILKYKNRHEQTK